MILDNISDNILNIAKNAEKRAQKAFLRIDEIAFENQKRVLSAFSKYKVSAEDLNGTNGYGYGDRGRDKLEEVYADLFGAESAYVRHSIVSGTHALSLGLFGLLRPGDTMLSVTGKPYDTLDELIFGKTGNGTLADFSINYKQVDLINGKSIDFNAVSEALTSDVKVVYVQRSKGYMDRATLSSEQIGKLVEFVKARSSAYVVVDNCYGLFTDTKEPSHFGADLCIGSLIKNAGGGIARTGGYLVGTKKAVELAAYRATAPGLGGECGASLDENKFMYRGLFMAPHTVAQAVKTSVFAAAVFEEMGYEVSPSVDEERYDIIQLIKLKSAQKLCAFCKGLQAASPIDSFAEPIPDDMAGYQDKIIMAAGAFVMGSSIELSADGPLKEPFNVYLQGGLTYESGKLGIIAAANEVSNVKEESDCAD